MGDESNGESVSVLLIRSRYLEGGGDLKFTCRYNEA